MWSSVISSTVDTVPLFITISDHGTDHITGPIGKSCCCDCNGHCACICAKVKWPCTNY